MRIGTALLLIFTVLLAAVCFQFGVENSQRTTTVSLRLFFGGWELSEPVSVVRVIVVSFGAGALLVGIPAIARIIQLSSRLRRMSNDLG